MLKSHGWKGILAGIGLMLFALVGAILGQVGFESSISMDITKALTLFLEGLGILGIRVALNR